MYLGGLRVASTRMWERAHAGGTRVYGGAGGVGRGGSEMYNAGPFRVELCNGRAPGCSSGSLHVAAVLPTIAPTSRSKMSGFDASYIAGEMNQTRVSTKVRAARPIPGSHMLPISHMRPNRA